MLELHECLPDWDKLHRALRTPKLQELDFIKGPRSVYACVEYTLSSVVAEHS